MAMTKPVGIALRGPGYLAARRNREAFTGLPPAFKTRWDILDLIVSAGKARPIGAGAILTTFTVLLARTPNAAWRNGQEPVVWLGTTEIAGMVGTTNTTIERHLAALEAAGLIERRYAKRRRLISLAPALAVALELRQAADEARQRRRELAEHAHELGEIATDLAGLRARAEHLDRPADERARLSELETSTKAARAELKQIRRRDGAADRAQKDVHVQTVLRHLQAARAAWTAALSLVDNSHLNHTKICTQAHFDVGRNLTTESLIESGIQPWTTPNGENPAPEPSGQHWHRPVQLSDDCLKGLSEHYTSMRPIFPGPLDSAILADIGRTACLRAGVSRALWDQACARHGSTKAALAALAALEKPACQLRARNRGALLVGMFRKPTEHLNPVASLYGYHTERQRHQHRQEAQPWRP